jgi:hypothetical protein
MDSCEWDEWEDYDDDQWEWQLDLERRQEMEESK